MIIEQLQAIEFVLLFSQDFHYILTLFLIQVFYNTCYIWLLVLKPETILV